MAADKNADRNTQYVWTDEETTTFLELVQVFAVFALFVIAGFFWSSFLSICFVALNYDITLRLLLQWCNDT